MSEDRFDECWPETLAQECPLPSDWSNPKNFSQTPHDSGGATMCGIIQREYDAYRKRTGEHVQSVRLITKAEGEDIYRESYWEPYAPLMPPGLNLSFFDTSVNEGSHEAVKILQFALHIPVDGAWGPETEAAVEKIPAAGDGLAVVIQKFTNRRAAVYRLMPDDQYFDKGWQRRTQEIGATSLKMAEAA